MKEKQERKQEHITTVRFPQQVWEQLTQLAADEERSINWEIIESVRERITRKKKGGKKTDEDVQI